MQKFGSVDEILDFAIKEEQEAAEDRKQRTGGYIKRRKDNLNCISC